MERNRQKAVDQARRGAAFRGDLFSTGSQRVEGDVNVDAANRANTLLADLFNQERNRQAAAVNPALALAQAEVNEPLAIAQAQQSLGALPRLVETDNLNRALQDFNRQRGEQNLALQLAGPASNSGQPLLGQDTFREPTILGSLASSVLPSLGQGLGQNLGANLFQPQSTGQSQTPGSIGNLVQLAQGGLSGGSTLGNITNLLALAGG